MLENNCQSTENYMLQVKDKAHKSIFRGSWRKRPSKMTHDLLFEMKYGDFLDHLAFLVHCIETNADVNDYEAYNKMVNAQRREVERKMKQETMNERKNSNKKTDLLSF